MPRALPGRARPLVIIVTTMCALAVAAAEPVPVPLNLCGAAQASASSQEGDRFAPELAIDGRPVSIEGAGENAWCSAMDQPSRGQWLAVEFPDAQPITEVRVWYRVIENEHRFVPRTVTIQASPDGERWTTLVSRSDDLPRLRDAPDA